MTVSYVFGTIGLAFTLYGALKNRTEFSLSGLGLTIMAVLINAPPEVYTQQ